MAISMTKLSSADYYLDRTREALQADGAIPDEATPGPLTGPDPAAYYNAEGNPPGRWIGSASRLLGGETGRQAGAETVRAVADRWVPYIAVASPVICWVIESLTTALTTYRFGYELLMLNGALTFAGLWAVSRRTKG